MAQGFLSGLIWGGALSVVVAAVASISAGTAPVPQVGGTPGSAAAPAETPPAGATPVRDADLATDPAAPVPAPGTETAALDPEATANPQRPQAGQAGELAPVPEPDPQVSVTSPAAGGATTVPTAPAQPSAPSGAEVPSISTDPAQPPVPDTGMEGAFAQPETEPEPDPAPETAATPAPEPALTPTPDPQPPVTQPAFPQTDPEAAAAQPPAPSIGTPAGSLVGRDDPAGAPDAGPRPIDAFAAEFAYPEDKPLMAIVLIDDGSAPSSGPVGVAALQSFPYPLTFAIDASLPDAAERAATYRAQGHEVLVLTDLPAGATAGDVEVSLAAALDMVPEAVGVLEGSSAGFQGSREISDQVTAILADSGHGLLLQSKGLNTAQKLAVREGVPAAALFRDFDSAGQTPTVIRRFLDQAAFRAGQEEGVVMLGRVRADTISALLLWGLQDRATRVALVPVSAVLKAQLP
ncbi:MAG: divergent polysaccharide deacetylase family protein [Pseudomonadota bacterium]